MNRDLLDSRIERRLGGPDDARRVVVRQAGDLHDSGRYAETHGVELDGETIVANLAEAPDDLGIVERWNWWIGALELAHGGYDQFRVRRWKID